MCSKCLKMKSWCIIQNTCILRKKQELNGNKRQEQKRGVDEKVHPTDLNPNSQLSSPRPSLLDHQKGHDLKHFLSHRN